MSGDPIWFFFVVPVILILLQLLVLAIVVFQTNKIKQWWTKLLANDNDEDVFTLPSAQETRAKQLQHSKDRESYTKEKLLYQATEEE